MSRPRRRLRVSAWIVGPPAFLSILAVALAAGCERQNPAVAPLASWAGKGKPDTELPQPRSVVPPSQLSLYAGSARCTGCHPNEAGQLQSRHARTLSRTDPRLHE